MSTQPTQAHIEMAREICGRESDSGEQEYAAQLIADSEANAVEHAIATIIAKNAPEITKINTELAAMTARVKKTEAALDVMTTELGKMFLSAAKRADRNVELRRLAEKAEAECLEQARLLGMSASREASLLGKISQLERQLDATKAHT